MKKIRFILGMLLFLCGCSNNKPIFENKEELKIIVVSDLHYYDKSLFEQCSWFGPAWQNEDGQMIHYTHLFVENFISEVILEKPDMVLICGDLTYNGEKVSHESLSQQLYRLTEAGIVVAVINGNHDINNSNSLAYNEEGSYPVDSITVEEYKKLYADFGLNHAYSKDRNSLSYAVHLNDTFDLLVIDTCRDESYKTASEIQESTMKWIEKQLSYSHQNGKKTIVVMHHNLGIHCEAIYSGYVLENASEMQSLFSQYDVPIVFSGHSHIQHIKKFNNTTEIVSSALSIAPVQYGLVILNNEAIHYQTQEVQSVTGDEAFFKVASYNRFYPTLANAYGKEAATALANYMADVNLTYFSGNTYLYVDAFTQDSAYETLMVPTSNMDFFTTYLQTILREQTNHQETIIQLN